MSVTPPARRVPTIEDLRVKLCYICREEEEAAPLTESSSPSSSTPRSSQLVLQTHTEPPPQRHEPRAARAPPTAWVHPCKCTLIAHEACLLKWISSAQAAQGKRAQNAMKCPQCGAQYEMESDDPLILRLLDVGNGLLQGAGGLMVFGGMAVAIGVVGTSFYVICTGYGAWALKRFIGADMYDLLLGDDPANWPWSAYLNLPLLPFSLILSRFQASSSLPPIIPILLAMPSSFSPALHRKVAEYWRLPENARKLIGLAPDDTPASSSVLGLGIGAGSAWPPSPILFGLFGVPLVQMVYKRLYAKAYFAIMGKMPPERVAYRRRRRDRGQNANANGNANEAAGANANANVNGADEVEEADANEDVIRGVFDLRIRANVREERRDAAGAGANANANANGANGANNPIIDDNVLEINGSSLGRRVAGALLTPAIASWMGNLLLRFSHRSTWLRAFLAIRQPVGTVWVPPPLDLGSRELTHGVGALRQVIVGAQTVARGLWGSSRTFAESDPVWWRNSVGLGVFIVAKDALQLLHMYLLKKEIASRKVKSRDFSGVDAKELDLISPASFGVNPAATSSPTTGP